MVKVLTIAASCLLLVGCASLDGVAPGTLSKPERNSSFTLTGDVIGEMVSTNGFGVKTRYSAGLAKGKYVAVLSDSQGTYYQGEKDCVYNSLSALKNFDGGIWIPKAGAQEEPRFWFYLTRTELPQQIRGALLLELLADINVGNVKKEWSTKIEPFLLNEIHIQAE